MRAGANHPAPPDQGGHGNKRAPSRAKRAPLVMKGLKCRRKDGSLQKGLGKGARRDKLVESDD